MIRILTLFVGLMTGFQTVDLAVDDRVAQVELRIGDRVVAMRSGAPWRVRVDFGRAPSPSELVAVAYDRSGREVGRDARWFNVPSARAEVTLLPEVGDDGRVQSARVRWASPEFRRPRRIRAEVDGRRVRLSDDNTVDLSGFVPGRPHVLDVEVVFSREVRVRSELVFGERFSGSHDSGLTAAPLILLEGDALPPPEQMEGWLEHDGEPLRVAAVDKPPATLVIVPHPAVRTELERIEDEIDEDRRRRRRRSTLSDDLGEAEVYVLLPEPVVIGGDDSRRASLLFPVNEAPMEGEDGLLAAVFAPDRGEMIVSDLRLSNAVATAGMRAARDNDRRAVLLLLGSAADDHSLVGVEAARAYLRELRVPLVVWDLSRDRPVQPGWGAADVVTDAESFDDAVRALRYLLEQQWLVWVNGRILPQEVVVTDTADGVIPAMGG